MVWGAALIEKNLEPRLEGRGADEEDLKAMSRTCAVILAAGKGTRLKTEWPKVLHEISGRPMLAFVIDACRAAGIDDCIVVVGHGRQQVVDSFAGDKRLKWVDQTEQKGTGHAVMVCREAMTGYDEAVILCGDGPLIRAETIRGLVETHRNAKAAATLATAVLEDATGYGRIHRDKGGKLLGIVEHNDATPEQRAIREVNPSYYCFNVEKLKWALERITPNNAKKEYYITDVFGLLLADGQRVDAITSVPPEDIFSINSRRDLTLVNRVMRDRVNNRWLDSGVTIVDPATTWIDPRAEIGADTILYPNTHVQGRAQIGSNCRVGPCVVVADGAKIVDGATLAASAGAIIGSGVKC